MEHGLVRVVLGFTCLLAIGSYAGVSLACSGEYREMDDGTVQCPGDDEDTAENPYLSGGKVVDEDGHVRWVTPNYFDAYLQIPGVVHSLNQTPSFDLSQIILSPDPLKQPFTPLAGENEVVYFQEPLPYQEAQDAVSAFIYNSLGGPERVQHYSEHAYFLGIEVQSAYAAVHIRPHFKFTQPSPVVFTQNGSYSDNSITAAVNAQAEIHFDVSATGGASFMGLLGTVQGSAPISVLIGIHATADISLAQEGLRIIPTILPPVVTFSDDGSDYHWQLVGDLPLGWLLDLGLMWGLDETVESNLKQELERQIALFLPKAQEQAQLMITNKLMPKLDSYVARIQSAQDSYLATSVPGTGMTIGELFESNAHLDLRTRVNVPARQNLGLNGVTVSAALRLSNTAGSGSISGTIIIPKTTCELHRNYYVDVQIPGSVNTALTAGKSCAAVLNGAQLFRIYLGENPAFMLEDYAPEDRVPQWVPASDVIYSGVLEDVGNAFECHFELLSLPSPAILAIGPWSKTSAYASLSPDTHVYVYSDSPVGIGGLVNEVGTPTLSNQVVIGSAGPDLGGLCGLSTGTGPAEPAVPGLDPKGCPSCGFAFDTGQNGGDPFFTAPNQTPISDPWDFFLDGPDVFLRDPAGEVSKFPPLSAFYPDHEDIVISTSVTTLIAKPGLPANTFKLGPIKTLVIGSLPRFAVKIGTLAAIQQH